MSSSPAEVGRHTDWLRSLSPWPVDGFGLDRMRALLAALGDPQRGLRAVHVVGSNGKSTATRTIAELLRREGLRAGSTVSPHVRSWAERIQIDGEDVDLEQVLAVVRDAARGVAATQFETLVAAALVAFRDARVDVAVVEAGLGGRHDATNVLDGVEVVVLTNVSLEHIDVLGETREAIAAEKLAVIRPGCAVVLGEREWEGAARAAGAGTVRVVEGDAVGLAGTAAEAILGHPLSSVPGKPAQLPGRLERRPGEIRDGAHNPAGVAWLRGQLPQADHTIVASILQDKNATQMLQALAGLGSRFVATVSTNPRALDAAELGALARPFFGVVEVEPDPVAAVALAHGLGEPVLVTGSLYLLAELSERES